MDVWHSSSNSDKDSLQQYYNGFCVYLYHSCLFVRSVSSVTLAARPPLSQGRRREQEEGRLVSPRLLDESPPTEPIQQDHRRPAGYGTEYPVKLSVDVK